MSSPPVCRCGCSDAAGHAAHRIAASLAEDDLDRAIAEGLLDSDACGSCSVACREMLLSARDGRRTALAARERYRAREERLARRQQERAQRRQAASMESHSTAALPAAAAAALARARAKAAGPARE